MAQKKSIQPGELLPEPLIVRGHLVTMDERQPELDDGAMYVDRDGVIQAVQPAGDKAPPGFEDANAVEADGFVFPGLIDLHNHVAYNCLPLWSSAARPPDKPWDTRDQWPGASDYKGDISLPTNAICHADGKAVLKYVETKAVVGGVTGIQGSAKTKGATFEGWMVRNVEYDTFRTGKRTVNQSVRPIADKAGWKQVRKCVDQPGFSEAKQREDVGNAFLYHLCEGKPEGEDLERFLKDYRGMRDHGCLAGRFVGIHSTALRGQELKEWHRSTKEAALVWSPFSNLWLYGDTTDVVAAREAGVTVCLGADWSPSGSRNLLGELKVADLYNGRLKKADRFTDEALCRMATSNPADALGWDRRLGRLKKGLHADFVIVSRRAGGPYRALIESTEGDVELVAINGYPMYGTRELMKAGAAVNPEPVNVGRFTRLATLRDERIQGADMSWEDVLESLERIREDPPKGLDAAVARERKKHQEHLKLKADKHFDDPEVHEDRHDLEAGSIPALDGLAHDGDWFDEVDRRGYHDGILCGLRGYYPHVRKGRFKRPASTPAARPA
ncbi:MAG TPA: amidohydrolase family protein [Thermoleophilaceae bacterium]|jgi:cytosine/adenosine deaminase-related metal-dependent hydrolase